MEQLVRLQGSLDMAQMKHDAIGSEATKAVLDAAQTAYDDAVAAEEAAANDKSGAIVDAFVNLGKQAAAGIDNVLTPEEKAAKVIEDAKAKAIETTFTNPATQPVVNSMLANESEPTTTGQGDANVSGTPNAGQGTGDAADLEKKSE
ncbi:hypothetical protein [Fibrella aquatica]|uniref:hypothetical protein n=1 Tax=Fibrella aquatica TaxID=3242487 RepID=UPI003520227D